MKPIQNKTQAMRLIEQLAHQEIEEVLRGMYVDEEMLQKEISKELNIAPRIVSAWL